MKHVRLSAVLIGMAMFLCPVMGIHADGLMVRSPLFGGGQSYSAVPLAMQSYPVQLGLSANEPQETSDADNLAYARLAGAVGDANYPVTPGDTYRLSYSEGANRTMVAVQVDSTYVLDIPALGSIDCRNLTLPQLKDRVFALVATFFPHANPQFSLTAAGSFLVTVVGEVGAKSEVACWGLSRLSSTVWRATPYASVHRVRVRSADGTVRTYDLYRALQKGDLSQDPLLKSGDVVTYEAADRIVTLNGNVKRPGTYQLEPGEQLDTLLSFYGGGLLAGSDLQHIRVRRYDERTADWDTAYVDKTSGDDFSLQNQDAVMIDQMQATSKSITIEGAVKVTESVDPTTSSALLGQSSGRIFYQYYPGETVGDVMRTISGRFMTSSDLEKAYIVRDGQRIPLDVEDIISGRKTGNELTVEEGDVITIPFSQRFVTVSGAVARSGVYAYVPDKNADYYIAIAGGTTSDATRPVKVRITDKAGTRLERYDLIPPETVIDVKENRFVKNLAPTVAVVGLVASVAGIIYTFFETRDYYKKDY